MCRFQYVSMSKQSFKKPYHSLTIQGKRKRLQADNSYNTLQEFLSTENEISHDIPNQIEASLTPTVIDHETHSSSSNGSDSSDVYDSSECMSLDVLSSSDDENNGCIQESSESVKDFLHDWALEKNVPISTLSALCVGLKQCHSCFENLPVDGRTILKTPVDLQIISVPPGHYIHIGLKKQLNIALTHFTGNIMQLLFNIDGLPLFHSSQTEVYPILVYMPSVAHLKNKVFPVGIYCGEQKPLSLEGFLGPFLEELKDVITNGVETKSHTVKFEILGFCCDVPAKSYILGTIGHGGYSSCTRCHVHGSTVERRRVFLDLHCRKRTHEEFKQKVDCSFQPRSTPLVSVPGIDFVNSFPLEYMHLVCLGVMRTLLNIWNSGPLPLRLSATQRKLVSEKLLGLRSDIPAEFNRIPRELSYIKMWKATEFRSFLLYLGPLILKSILDEEKYVHFLQLHVAITILLNSKMCCDLTLRQYARSMLESFVEKTVELYGEQFITHNFHNLIHIVDDADHFSTLIDNFTLHSISAFPFENFLQKIKKMVRGKAKPLQQIGRRLGELFTLSDNLVGDSITAHTEIVFKKKHRDGPLLTLCVDPQYKVILFPNFQLSAMRPNNCCQVKNTSIVLIENIAFSKEIQQQVIIGRYFKKKYDFYTDPLWPSSNLGILRVDKLSSRKCWPVADVTKKYLCLSYGLEFVVFPLLHC